jgi:nitroreductase
MQTSELAALIKSRRSIRKWQDKPVPQQMLLDAIELGTWAPNSGNQQNWRFYVIFNTNTVKDIAAAWKEGASKMAYRTEMGQTSSNTPPGAHFTPSMLLSLAPAIIAVGTRRVARPMEEEIAKRAPTDDRAAKMLEWSNTLNARIQSVSAAIAYLLLALHQMGLGAFWMTGPLRLCKGEVEKILKVQDIDIVALIPVGYPAETPSSKRKPVSEVCEIIR